MENTLKYSAKKKLPKKIENKLRDRIEKVENGKIITKDEG